MICLEHGLELYLSDGLKLTFARDKREWVRRMYMELACNSFKPFDIPLEVAVQIRLVYRACQRYACDLSKAPTAGYISLERKLNRKLQPRPSCTEWGQIGGRSGV